MKLATAAAVLSLSATAVSCADPPPPAPFQVFVKVESDPGRPINGATIARAGKPMGTTGGDGRAMLKIPGAEGEVVDVAVTCPEGYTSPKGAVPVRLTRLADKSKVPEYSVSCPPNVRHVVVAVRAENGPHLPVLYLNRPIAKTDESGAAHFALDVAPGGQFQVTLDTQERKDIKPQMPGKIFVVAQQDDVLLFDQKFEVERRYVPPPPRPSIPKQIGPVRREF